MEKRDLEYIKKHPELALVADEMKTSPDFDDLVRKVQAVATGLGLAARLSLARCCSQWVLASPPPLQISVMDLCPSVQSAAVQVV